MSVNLIILEGFLGKDPEQRQAGSSTVTTFSIATNDGYGDHKKTNWHNVELWGKSGDAAAKHLKKGEGVIIRGEIDYQTWGEGDSKKYKTVIKAFKWDFPSVKRGATGYQTEDGVPITEGDCSVDNDEMPF